MVQSIFKKGFVLSKELFGELLQDAEVSTFALVRGAARTSTLMLGD